MENLLNVIQTYAIPLGLAALLVLILLIIVFRSGRKRRALRRFAALEVEYNELMSIPILYKINKANSLMKMNPNAAQEVEECKHLFDDLLAQQNDIAKVMADAEDATAFNKVKLSHQLMDDLSTMIHEGLATTKKLNERLDLILEEETQKRQEIVSVKEKYRHLKTKIVAQHAALHESYDVFEESFIEIENLFSAFEEWMYASDYQKAQDNSIAVQEKIDQLEKDFAEVPGIYELAKGKIPGLLKDLSDIFQAARQEDVYVEHLEVTKHISFFSDLLKEDLLRLKQGDFAVAKKSLEDVEKQLKSLMEELSKEHKASLDMRELQDYLFNAIDSHIEMVDALLEQKDKVESRFTLPDFAGRIAKLMEDKLKLQERKDKILRTIEHEKIPATTSLLSMRELQLYFEQSKTVYDSLDQDIRQVNADELRAQNQLLKLYLIMNDVQIRIRRRLLSSISEKYESDLKTAYDYTDQIQDLLSRPILDIPVLNATVDEAIDYIYKLHNNINNLVGVVDMCENAIVFANKYRAYVPEIDAELTRAEISFNNGEYTQSLAMLIKAIDKYRPNTAYEEMIKNNAASAR